MLRSIVAAVAVMAIVVAGCQAGPTVAPVPSSAPRSAGPSSAAATPSSEPVGTGSPVEATAAASGLDAREIGGMVGVLPAGQYTRRGFEPRITFQVDGSWRSVQTLRDFFDIQQLVGSPHVIAVQFAKPDGIVGANGVLAHPATAEAAVTALGANDGVVVVESSDSRIGGLEGKQVTVENPASSTGDREILHVPPGPLGISPARRLWIAFFDTPDGLLAIMIGGSVAHWDDALAAAEPVLESVTIGE